MPEIGEVARAVYFIQKHLVGKTLAVVKAQHDENVFGKVGTSAAEFEKNLTSKKVIDARQQGKYFWLIMSKPPHPLCHFGMAGWLKIRHEDTSFRKVSEPKDDSIWPPEYWKFSLETAEEPKCEAAFVDLRRFGRVRLIDCEAKDIRLVSPLKENGPDPVVDREIVTEQWLAKNLKKKKLHIKKFLLDQAIISGIGNWVGDEILYQAAIHPEQSTQNLSSAQISRLYTSLHHVTYHAVSTLADPNQIPESWLFEHRWGKGKKDSSNKLPNGASISHITVGGRTSAVVLSVQKKTGAIPKTEDVEEKLEAETEDAPKEPKKSRGKTTTSVKKSKATKPSLEPKDSANSPPAKPRPEKKNTHPNPPDPSTSKLPNRTTPATPLQPKPDPGTKKSKPSSSQLPNTHPQKRKPGAQPASAALPKKRKAPSSSRPTAPGIGGADGDDDIVVPTGEDGHGRRRSGRIRGLGV